MKMGKHRPQTTQHPASLQGNDISQAFPGGITDLFVEIMVQMPLPCASPLLPDVFCCTGFSDCDSAQDADSIIIIWLFSAYSDGLQSLHQSCPHTSETRRPHSVYAFLEIEK